MTEDKDNRVRTFVKNHRASWSEFNKIVDYDMENHNDLFNKANVGALQTIIKKVNPSSPEDFKDKYLEYMHKDRSFLLELSTKAQKLLLEQSDMDVPLGDCANFVYHKLFIDNYDGWKGEDMVISEFQRYSQVGTIVHGSSRDDSYYSIDSIVKVDGTVVAAIQVKSISYLYGKSEALFADKQAHKKNNDKFLKDNNLPDGRVFYVFYKKDFSGKKEIVQNEYYDKLRTYLTNLC